MLDIQGTYGDIYNLDPNVFERVLDEEEIADSEEESDEEEESSHRFVADDELEEDVSDLEDCEFFFDFESFP